MNPSRDPPSRDGQPQLPRDELLAPATQLVSDREAYLGQGRHDVGRRVAPDQVELFIHGDVAPALAAEFEQHSSDFIAVHDVGTTGSLRLLASLAQAAGAPVQRLSVRRQGQGIALAVLQFVEVSAADAGVVRRADAGPIRVYATDMNADSQSRQRAARLLLSHSRLGVLLVGELPPHALSSALNPLHEALLRGPWRNRELLMVPLGSGTALAAQATQLGADSVVAVHVSPRAVRPEQVWSFISGTWNRLHSPGVAARTLHTEIDQAVTRPGVPLNEVDTEPMGLDPLERTASAAAPAPMPVPGATRWQAYAERCLSLPGAASVCVFDVHSMHPMAHAGGTPAPERLAQQGAVLLAEMKDVARALGLGAGEPEASVSTGTHHLLLRPVPGHSGVVVHIVLLASAGPPALARLQLERIAPPQ